MYQAYAGQVRNGQPMLTESVELPENASLIITIVDELPFLKTKAQRQNEALKRFFAVIDKIEDEPITDEDLLVLEHNRANFHRKAF